MESIDYWYHLMNQPHSSLDGERVTKMVKALEGEYPRLCSLILERACNLQCLHCIFQPEKTSLGASQAVGYSGLACRIISQMAPSPSVIHEGRILRDWHLSLFASIHKLRPDAKVGLIDNGTYLRQEKYFREHEFLLDWMDISFDGTKEVHNRQRNNPTAFDVALKGAQEATNFVRPKTEGGKVTTLFTVTNLNYHDVYNTAVFLFGQELIDEFHITPFSPVRTEIEPLFFCPGYKEGRVEECKVLWEQVTKIYREFHGKGGRKVFVRLYQQADLEKFARAVGVEKFLQAFGDKEQVSVDQGSVSFVIDGVRITYVPLSICPSETFVIDADGAYRMAYCLKYTLEELNGGLSKEGKDTRPYTVAKLSMDSNFHDLFRQGVSQWMGTFGHEYLQQEFELFSRLRSEVKVS